MGLNIVEKIDDKVKINRALISVSDKTGLEKFVPRLIDINPEIRIFSTGGTFDVIRQIVGPGPENRLCRVSDYTGQPETRGGLVKTLDFKIYLGLLTEKYNDAHNKDLRRTDAVHIDLVVVNLYPFEKVVAKKGAALEEARGNMDIGGPCMIRAAAKNFIRVACVVDPASYGDIIKEISPERGRISLDSRFKLAKKAFWHTASYDRAIANFLDLRTLNDMRSCYKIC